MELNETEKLALQYLNKGCKGPCKWLIEDKNIQQRNDRIS